MFKTELLEFDIGPPPLPPMLSKTEFAIKFAGSDSVLGNAVSKRPLLAYPSIERHFYLILFAFFGENVRYWVDGILMVLYGGCITERYQKSRDFEIWRTLQENRYIDVLSII